MKQLIFLIGIATLAGCFGKEPVKSGKEGRQMFEFSVLLMDSVTLLHSSNIQKGKSSVLFYFSPFCPYCKAQTKKIIEDMGELKDIRFYFVSNFPFNAVKKFSSDYQLSKYPNVSIGVDTASTIANYFEITGVPFLAIYNKDKVLSRTYKGTVNTSDIQQASEEKSIAQ